MSERQDPYNIGLDKTPANYVPLSPLSFLARSAAVYPNHVSTVYEGRSFTWRETHERCKRFASWLGGKGIGVGYYAACAIGRVDPAEGIRPILGYMLALLVGLIIVAIFPWISIGFL